MRAVFFGVSAAVSLQFGLVRLVTADGTIRRTPAAILLLIVTMVLFGMTPMRCDATGIRT